MRYLETGLWADVRELPGALRDTLAAREGVAEAAGCCGDGVERIVATGNGAAYYVAHALWLASLESRGAAADRRRPVRRRGPRAASAGSPATPCSRCPRRASSATWSRSRARAGGRPCVAITADADSSLAAAATATVVQRVVSQRAVTHTQALAGAYASGLALWAAVTGDAELDALLDDAGDAAERGGRRRRGVGRRASCRAVGTPPAAIAVGGGPAWAAALELALMLKEISRIPAEGVETREGATSAMFGLDRGHLMVSLDPAGDPLGDEAVRLCAAAGAATLRLPGARRPTPA